MRQSNRAYPHERMVQLDFEWPEALDDSLAGPDPVSPEELQTLLEDQTGLTVQLTVTDNISSMMSVRRNAATRTARVRLHHMFLSANREIQNSLAKWIRNPKEVKAGAALDQFIRDMRHLIRKPGRRRIALRTEGKQHDLQALFDDVNATHFKGQVTARITWGRRSPNHRPRRSIRFGSYSVRDHLIRINPALDCALVPHFFIRYIVFHEMLHAFLGVAESENGRRRIHPPEFRRQEQAYPDFDRAMAWENDPNNIRKLLR